jgi:hypothetical protein
LGRTDLVPEPQAGLFNVVAEDVVGVISDVWCPTCRSSRAMSADTSSISGSLDRSSAAPCSDQHPAVTPYCRCDRFPMG